MKKRRILTLLIGAFLLFSCGGTEKEDFADPIFENAFVNDLTLYFDPEYDGYFVADYKGSLPYIRIPDSADGEQGEAKIVGIQDNAFYRRENLKGVSLGANIQYLGGYAFDQSGVEYLYVNSSLTTISEDAFVGANIKKRKKDDVYYLPGEDFPYKFAVGFVTEEKHPSIALEEGCVGVLDGAFDGLYTNIRLPSSLRYLGDHKANVSSGLSNMYSVSFANDEANLLYSGGSSSNGINKAKKVTFLAGARGFSGQLSVPKLEMARDIKEVGTISGEGEITFLGTPDEWKTVKGANKALFNDTKLTFLDGGKLTLGKEDAATWSNVENYQGIKYIEYVDDVESYMNLKSHPVGAPIHLLAVKDGKLVIPEGTEEIPAYAFRNVENITEVEIPASVTSIGRAAFYNCANLTEVVLPPSLTNLGASTFEGCASLTEITIPASLKTIPEKAFSGCSSLATVLGGDSLRALGEKAFEGCEALTSFPFPKDCVNIRENAFEGTSLPKTEKDGLTYYASQSSPYYFCAGVNDENPTSLIVEEGCECTAVFAYLEKVAAISFPSTLRGMHVLSHLPALKSLSIKAPLQYWGGFDYCPSLRLSSLEMADDAIYAGGSFMPSNSVGAVNYRGDIASFMKIGRGRDFIPWHLYFGGGEETTAPIVPEGVTDIPSLCFAGCQSITSISLPSSLESIAEDAFLDCPKLQGETKNGVIYLGNDSCPYLFALNGKGASGSLQIEEGCVSIGKGAFASSSITNVVFPSSLRQIPSEAFTGSRSLQSVDLPGTLSSVGGYAFSNCTGLKEVRIGVGIENVGRNLFNGCPNIEKIAIGSFFEGSDDDYGCIESLFFYQVSTSRDEARSIKEVNILEGVEVLKKGFGSYLTLDKATLPASLKSAPFFYASKVKKLEIAQGSPYIHETSQGLMHTDDALIYVSSEISGDVTIPEGIASIPGGAFSGNDKIRAVTLPDSLKTIGSGAFSDSSLTSINLPEGIERIEDYAFCDSKLSSLVLPSGLNYVGDYSLGGVSDVTIYATGSGLVGANLPFTGHDGYSLTTIRFRGDPKEWGRIWRKLYYGGVIHLKQNDVIFE